MFRRSFFVKPSLQFKYLAMSLLLTLVSTGIVYLTLNHILFTSERLMELSTFEIEMFQKQFRMGFVWVAAILMVLFGVESLLRFHKLVGPLYVVEKIVNTIAGGDLTQTFHLRKHDELQDLVSELIVMQTNLRNGVAADRKLIKSVNDKLAQIQQSTAQGASPESLAKDLESVRQDIAQITSQFKI